MDQPVDSGVRATRFRFKGQKSKRSHPQNDDDDDDGGGRASSPSKRRRRTNRHNRPDINLLTNESNPINTDTAFTESLFDALADDEGAAYWENIYGQPIHIYKRPTKYNPQTNLYEPCTDDEYAAHVRQKMWEHTHAGAIEEMRRRKKEHQEHMEEERQHRRQKKEEARLAKEMEQALRRGEARKKAKSYEDNFAKYVKAWETWDGTQENIPWPTGSGTRKGVVEKSVRSFFINGIGNDVDWEEFAAKLKEQRVRWHPDKMQQKMGGKDQVTKGVMADITMIFQVIDTLYNDFRKASK